MTATVSMVYKLLPSFYWDHVARDFPEGHVVEETRKNIWVSLTPEEAISLYLDAVYYRDHMTVEAGNEDQGLVQSAKWTAIRLIEQANFMIEDSEEAA